MLNNDFLAKILADCGVMVVVECDKIGAFQLVSINSSRLSILSLCVSSCVKTFPLQVKGEPGPTQS